MSRSYYLPKLHGYRHSYQFGVVEDGDVGLREKDEVVSSQVKVEQTKLLTLWGEDVKFPTFFPIKKFIK